MADTKKEHYVPRCYLRNFASSEERINVFDKQKMQVRPNQRILDVAMENHFYDLDFLEMMDEIAPENKQQHMEELKKLLKTDDLDNALKKLSAEKHIEKNFFSQLESIYALLLTNIIKKSYGGNEWVMKNCYTFSEEEKALLSLFIAIQIIRTRSFRDNITASFEKAMECLAYKSQMKDEDSLPREYFEVKANEDFIKLTHTEMILDPEMAVEFAKILNNHIWVVYVNKTNTPFYTSDDPVVNIPHKKDKFLSYAGLNSEAIEIVFPISPNLLLGMYDKRTYGDLHSDRSFLPITLLEHVEYFNQVQVIHSKRCIFSISDDFKCAIRLCIDNPDLRVSRPNVEVF